MPINLFAIKNTSKVRKCHFRVLAQARCWKIKLLKLKTCHLYSKIIDHLSVVVKKLELSEIMMVNLDIYLELYLDLLEQ